MLADTFMESDTVERLVVPLIDGRIQTEIKRDGEIVSVWYFNTTNEKNRSALIDLGWKPPTKTVDEQYKD
jgi:hypothetical protein